MRSWPPKVCSKRVTWPFLACLERVWAVEGGGWGRVGVVVNVAFEDGVHKEARDKAACHLFDEDDVGQKEARIDDEGN